MTPYHANSTTIATTEQARALALRRRREPQPCIACGAVKLMRDDQKHCSSACRKRAMRARRRNLIP